MKKGFTLVEMMVSIALFMIIVSVAIGGFITALRTQRQIGALISSQSNVSLAVEQMAREIRTGYLFCHDAGNNTPSPACGCTTHNFPPPSNDPYWTCSALNFYNSEEVPVGYLVQNGALMRSDGSVNNGGAAPLISNDVVVKNLSFQLFGNQEGDKWTPRITIFLTVSPSSTNQALANTKLNFQTTISARQIDCDPNPLIGC